MNIIARYFLNTLRYALHVKFTYGRGIYKAPRKVNVDIVDWYDMALDRIVWNGVRHWPDM